MCEATVILQLCEYNRLRDFEKSISQCVWIKGLCDDDATTVVVDQGKLGRVIAQYKTDLLQICWDDDRDRVVWTQKEVPTA